MNLDKKDRQLLLLLQEDSKRTTKSLAADLDLSVTAVFERIKKLEKLKIIEKYVALVDRKLIQKDFLVLLNHLYSSRKLHYLLANENNCQVEKNQ